MVAVRYIQSFLLPIFASGLAQHAAATARRYPWIADWIPVNEPCTTARFSCLYGHWYPHLRDERSFWLALLNQIDATRLAMREIRRVNAECPVDPNRRFGKDVFDLGSARSSRFRQHPAMDELGPVVWQGDPGASLLGKDQRLWARGSITLDRG
jgi:hypothetical protein